MKKSVKSGLGFGIASGIVTTLGLMVGLDASTGSKLSVVGGIITIAIADAVSDSLGIHISKEAERKYDGKEIWLATISTFVFKFLFASTFLIPLFLFSLSYAVKISIVWGLSLLTLFSYYIAKKNNENVLLTILEHDALAVFVIIVTYLVGNLVSVLYI